MKYTCKLLHYYSLQGGQGEQQQDGFQVELLEHKLHPSLEKAHSKGAGENNIPHLLTKKPQNRGTDAHSINTSKSCDMAAGQTLVRTL